VTDFLLFAVVAACLASVLHWRYGLIICVAVGLLQDPLRKITPGAPVYMAGLVAIAFACACVGAWTNRVKFSPTFIHGWRQSLHAPAAAFLAVLAAQAIHSVARWQNILLPMIGAIFYLAPVIAVLFAYQFALRAGTAGIRRYIGFYVAVSLVWFVGVLLESMGSTSRFLGEVGPGQIIYSFGLNRKAASGFYRAAEVAAWHIATVSCMLFIFLNGRRLSAFKTILVMAVAAFLIYVGVVTGRRKMLVYVVVFGGAYLVLVSWYVRGKARLALFSILALLIAFGMVLGLGPDDGERSFDAGQSTLAKRDVQAAWVARGLTVFADIPDRFNQLAYRPVQWAVEGFGWFGAGLGTIAQGAQHFGGGAARFGGAAEGGLGKITMDLGVPGVAIAIWLIWTLFRLISARLLALARSSRAHANLAFGLVAFLVANVAAFSVATQVFGDVLILLMLGWTLGFVLAMPAVAFQETQALAQPAQMPVPIPVDTRLSRLTNG